MNITTWNLQAARAETKAINAPIIYRLQDELREAIARVLPGSGDYAILDFPNYSNIGDSAIYVGEAILLRERFERDPKLVTEARENDLERIANLEVEVPLVLHGGGNFGDLYPRHQHFREAILRRFQDRKIVLFPQSIYFEAGENIERSADAINAHPDFTMMVRDHVSLAFARKHYNCNVLLVPDMAFMIGPVSVPQLPDLRILGLIRQDKESILLDPDPLKDLPGPFDNVDWPAEAAPRSFFEKLPQPIRQFLPPALQGRRPASPSAFEFLARQRVQRGFETLARGEIVFTDRLHAHILSLLLGIPHVVLDNSYGKISNFVSAWTDGGGFVRSTSILDALSTLRALEPDYPDDTGAVQNSRRM